jgi:hypothetical protein
VCDTLFKCHVPDLIAVADAVDLVVVVVVVLVAGSFHPLFVRKMMLLMPLKLLLLLLLCVGIENHRIMKNCLPLFNVMFH